MHARVSKALGRQGPMQARAMLLLCVTAASPALRSIAGQASVEPSGCHYYVDVTGAAEAAANRVGSITEARAAVRTALARNRTLSRDLVVCLGPGVHQASPLSFDRQVPDFQQNSQGAHSTWRDLARGVADSCG